MFLITSTWRAGIGLLRSRILMRLLCVFTLSLSLSLNLSVSLTAPFWGSTLEPAWASDAKKPGEGKAPAKKRRRVKKEPAAADEKEKKTLPAAIGSEAEFPAAEGTGEQNKERGIDAVIILDASRSMRRTDPARLRDQGAKLFLRFLDENDRVGIIQFAEETKVVLPLTTVTPELLTELDTAISNIPLEGNFTDLWSPIGAAFELLESEGRHDSIRTVILLSDGKMDPHPNVGTGEELTKRLFEADLPGYRKKGIQLYTLALSAEADKDLLGRMARATESLSWFTPDVNTAHQIFSDLFLTLKRPQVVEMQGEGFEVDGTTSEATFYISRKSPDQTIYLVDPTGREFSNREIPPGWKWFRGELFDVITIATPLPGRWGVRGAGEQASGFATLLTDLKLEVSWPENNLRIGDKVVLRARLIDKGNVVEPSGMKEITFYSYKIIDSATGKLILQGSLNDKGEDGDTQPNDNAYAATLKLDEEGEFKVLIAVTAPTFSRQQHLSFSVSRGLVALLREPANEFLGTEESFKITLEKKALELKKIEVQLVVRKKGEKKALGIQLQKYQRDESTYDVPVHLLDKGEYELMGLLSGTDEAKKKVRAISETILFVSEGRKLRGKETEEEQEQFEIEEIELTEAASSEISEEVGEEEAVEEEASEVIRYLLWGLIGLLVSGAFVGGLGLMVYRRMGKEDGVSVEVREPFQLSTALNDQLEAIRTKSSERLRHPRPKELEMFTEVKDVFTSLSFSEEEESESESSLPNAEPEVQAESEGAES